LIISFKRCFFSFPPPSNMSKYILALDQGTTSSRAILFDRKGQIVNIAQKEFKQHFPEPGWVEHDPEEIWLTQRTVAEEVMMKARTNAREIAAIGITNQRETTVVWNRKTGKPIGNAIVWQDRRTATRCDNLKKKGKEPEIRAKTGLVLDAYFSATKIGWLLDHVPGARDLADAGELAFGTIDSWLIWKLTGGTSFHNALHVTDVSNASRTQLFNLQTGDWDDTLCLAFNVPPTLLPHIVKSSGVIGSTAAEVFGIEIPIAGIAGDQQAALFGQNCVKPGMAKNTYGTGCFMLMHTGDAPQTSQHGLLTTAAAESDAARAFALEGSVFVGGAVVQWLRDGLQTIRATHEVEGLAASVPDTGGVVFVPAFVGLGAPYWDASARGAMLGLTRGTGIAHIARAAVESIAFQCAELVTAMQADAGITLTDLHVDGGAAANNLLMQFQADLLGVPVVRPKVLETTALGAAMLAGLAVGNWQSRDELATLWQQDRRFEPAMSRDEAAARMAMWKKAVEKARGWV
jgi:glycerol kinase